MDIGRLVFIIYFSLLNIATGLAYYHYTHQYLSTPVIAYIIIAILLFVTVLGFFSLEKNYNIDGEVWYFFGNIKIIMSSLFILGLLHIISFYFACQLNKNLLSCAETLTKSYFMLDTIIIGGNLLIGKIFNWQFKIKLSQNSLSITQIKHREPDEPENR